MWKRNRGEEGVWCGEGEMEIGGVRNGKRELAGRVGILEQGKGMCGGGDVHDGRDNYRRPGMRGGFGREKGIFI